jgi:hypothetical protein
MRLPVIVERNAWTLPQERYNTEWVTEHQVGLVVRSFKHIVSAVSTLLQDLPRYRQNAAATENRALFEVADILKSIAQGHPNNNPSAVHARPANVTT